VIDALPGVNATLNTLSAVLLVLGWRAVRLGRKDVHRRCMIAALVCSALFLASYLTYHFRHGATRYQGEGAVRVVYFAILISHTILAAVNLPMVIVTVVLAARGRFERHRRIARWTLPIWLYVSITGVLVYLMLYRL